MKIFQIPYNFLRSLKYPKWINNYLNRIEDDVLFPLLKKVGEEVIRDLQKTMINLAVKNLTGPEKKKLVLNEMKNTWNEIKDITKSEWNLLLETEYAKLKAQKLIY